MSDSFLALEDADANAHVRPYVRETLDSKSLHFCMDEIQSTMHLMAPDALALAYTRTMMGVLLFNPRPATLAMIGLGGGSLAKFCHRHLPATRIKVLEINPHVLALRREFKVPDDDARFKVLLGDGADFVRFPPYQLDVLLVDGFDYHGQPPALCTQRFYDDCRDALQPGGLLAVNLHTGHVDFALHLARLERSFDGELLVISDEDCSNTIVIACRGRLPRLQGTAALRCPAGFDAQAWSELLPAFEEVVRASRTGDVQASISAEPPAGHRRR
ncbi:transferase [Pelomonas sp. BJYL3]|uniref:spermine/spermidine synthase domain-containing protein n=1 Tax=Pelomonas sp. BJYL3 TaxID=2976697 RepID=UPI0022B5DC1B|nr:transferase [Pelomonas sp. BJYL3]